MLRDGARDLNEITTRQKLELSSLEVILGVASAKFNVSPVVCSAVKVWELQ